MKKCKITVLRKTFQKDLAEEYGIDGLTTCPMLQEGQVFYADWECPEGFCNEAWKAIYQYVFALAHGVGKNGELFYYGDWIRSLELQSVRVMMDCVQLYLKLKQNEKKS